ncbi:restriction endonuclease subunit S [Teredinibacter turnerae]|uniref:restriction endonuclease subunit S n=1 Tax=Teredinibacter turnerae TaxID=2426 RepID=UPI000381014A|nr:restriction endonuclease subunit S [Teredinibacter turnerae]
MSVELTTLEEYIKVQGGYAYKSKDFSDTGIFPVLKIKNVRFGTIDYSEVSFISEEIAKETTDWKTKEGDILISMTGSGPNAPQSLVGRVARVWEGEPEAWINQRVGRIVLKDKNKIHPDFIFYLLSSPKSQDYLVSNSSGSANQANISGKTIESLPCPKIGYDQSAEIAKILREIDQKILINNKANQTLEDIAHAIFKSWFVDFDPTHAKISAKENGQDPELAAMAMIAGKDINKLDSLNDEQLGDLKSIAALFPNDFDESEFGEIPEGWSVRKFGDVSNCLDSKRIPLSKKQRQERKPGHIPYYGATSVMDNINEWIFDDVYLLLGEDGSVIKEDGTPFVQYIWGKSWINNHAHVLQGKSGVSTEQLMIFIQNQNITSYVTGAVQLKLNQKNMNSIPFLDAGEMLNKRFQDLIAPLYQKIRVTADQNRTLGKMRDSLLPQLLSGRLVGDDVDG